MKEIKGIARVKFFPGKVDEWKRLTEQAMEIVRTRDTGTLQYDIPVLAMRPAWLCAEILQRG
jgi:quinol monooxygenase YgiN